MSKIVKSHGVHLTKDVFKIREIPMSVPRPAPVLNENGEEIEQPQAVYQEEILPHPVQEEIIQGAMAEAARILEDAVKEAETSRTETLAHARYEAERLKKEASEEGRRHGFASAVGDIKAAAQDLENAIAKLEADRAGFEIDFEEKLKWMSAEIASKVLAKKVAEDDTEMLEMVEKAVRSVQREPWVRVEVAADMKQLIERLTDLFAQDGNVEISGVPEPVGTVKIETPSGVVDASLVTQLNNIKAYFAKIT